MRLSGSQYRMENTFIHMLQVSHDRKRNKRIHLRPKIHCLPHPKNHPLHLDCLLKKSGLTLKIPLNISVLLDVPTAANKGWFTKFDTSSASPLLVKLRQTLFAM
jgi:hypothetical protein